MISARESEEYLHTEVILKKISEYDIFRYYCPNFKEPGVKFCSDLRKDSTPSVSIVEWKSGLLYKDFGYPDHTFNCFSYVMHKYGLTFVECLKVISNDFGLKLASNKADKKAVTYTYTPVPKKHTRIKVRRRMWKKEDQVFWSKYGINQRLLMRYGVTPIDYFWINDARFRVKSIGYAFKFKDGYKIYQPYEEEDKWYSNVGKNSIQGYAQLPDTGEVVFLTSSLKDVMTIAALGYPAVALQSEMTVPDESFVQELKQRFTIIVLLYDNDFKSEHNPGQTMARKLCKNFNFINLCIPEDYGSKDISDLVSNHGLGVGEELISNTLIQK